MPSENRYLIAIGSPEAPHMGLSHLPKVENDVERIVSFFTSPQQNYQRVLANEIPLGAEARVITSELERWFSASDRREDDCVVVYFAGHGDEFGTFKTHFLFTSDSRAAQPTTTAIETAAIPKLFFTSEVTHPGSILLIIDTCYSGNGGGRAAATVAAAKQSISAEGGAGFWVLASAGSSDTAADGAFVRAFESALKDSSRFGPGGSPYISIEELTLAINEQLLTAGQRAEWDVVGGGKARAQFIRNKDDSQTLAGATLEDLHHWELKARGVEAITLPGDYFVGRDAALRVLKEWLSAPESDGRARVVTGGPGSGKSAVLGRLVLAMRQEAVSHAPIVAIHAHSLNLSQIAESLGRQLAVQGDVDSILLSLQRPGPPIRMVLDALDEAVEPRLIEDRLLVPMASLPRARLIVGTRRDLSGRLPLGSGTGLIDLDSDTYFQEGDIAQYTLRRFLDSTNESLLQVPAAELKSLARVIAERSDKSFLYARVVSRWLMTSGIPVDTHLTDWVNRVDLPKDILDAFGRDLDRFDPDIRQRFIDLLVPLAYAQGKGLPQKSLWYQLASTVAGRPFTNADIRELKERAGFYIVRDSDDDDTVYRLFHEAFSQYLRDLTRDENVHHAMYETLRANVPADSGGRLNWSQVREPYILNYLVVHAVHAGALDELLTDSEFLLHANPRTLTSVLRTRAPAPGGMASAYLRAYPHMLARSLCERVQYLSLAAAQYNCTALSEQLRSRQSLCDWYPAKAWYRDTGSHILGPTPNLRCACLVRAPDGVPQIAVAEDSRVRVLSLATGEVLASAPFEGGPPRSMDALPSNDDMVILMAHERHSVSVLNISRQNQSPQSPIFDTLSLHIRSLGTDKDPLFAVGTESGLVSIWSVAAFQELRNKQAHKAGITYLGLATLQGKQVLLTCSDSYRKGRRVESVQIRVWDPESFELLHEFAGPEGNLAMWCAIVHAEGTPYLAAYFSPSRSYFLYDVKSGGEIARVEDKSLKPFGTIADGKSTIILSGSSYSFCSVHISGSRTLEMKASESLGVEAGAWLGPVQFGGRPIVVSAGNNVRVWDVEHLLQNAGNAVEAEVGQVYTDGEPLFGLSAPQTSAYFAGLSRYGNLRIWSASGECLWLRRIITSLDQGDSNDYDHLQMVDFTGRCFYVTSGRSGVIQARTLEGSPMWPALRIPAAHFSSVHIHVVGERILAVVGAESGPKNRYQVSVWDLQSGEEVTASGRAMVEQADDKTIDQVAAFETAGKTVVVACLFHSYYHYVQAWDLSAAADPDNERFGLSARQPLWSYYSRHQISSLTMAEQPGFAALAVADNSGTVTLLNPSTGEPRCAYRAHEKQIVGLACTSVAGQPVILSAGMEGTIVGTCCRFDQDNEDVSPFQAFLIDIADRPNALAAISGGRVVAGTEQGFLLFQLSNLD